MNEKFIGSDADYKIIDKASVSKPKGKTSRLTDADDKPQAPEDSSDDKTVN